MNTFSFTTGAKINLGLSIQGQTGNGYHLVETVMTRIPLADDVTISFPPHLSDVSIFCEHHLVPNNSNNLLYRAYRLIQADYDLPNAQISLLKRLPVGAGLGGGGSFNAAGLLCFLNRHFRLQLSSADLQCYALQIGSDTAFAVTDFPSVYECHHGQPDLVQTALPGLPDCQIALIFQDLSLSTVEIYAQMDHLTFVPSNLAPLVAALQAQDLAAIAANLHNDFTHYIFTRYPQLAARRQQLLSAGALGVGLSGKGPTLFALYPPDYQAPAPIAAAVLSVRKHPDE